MPKLPSLVVCVLLVWVSLLSVLLSFFIFSVLLFLCYHTCFLSQLIYRNIDGWNQTLQWRWWKNCTFMDFAKLLRLSCWFPEISRQKQVCPALVTLSCISMWPRSFVNSFEDLFSSFYFQLMRQSGSHLLATTSKYLLLIPVTLPGGTAPRKNLELFILMHF